MNKEENENEVYNALPTTFNLVEEAVEELGLSKRVKWKNYLGYLCRYTKKDICPTFVIDNGLIDVNSASVSSDDGKLLENLVFLSLRRKGNEIYYHKQEKECDFVIKKGKGIISAFQVCWKLDSDNKDREIRGLLEAMDRFNLREGLILTFNQEDNYVIDGKKIKVVPTWKWLLEK